MFTLAGGMAFSLGERRRSRKHCKARKAYNRKLSDLDKDNSTALWYPLLNCALNVDDTQCYSVDLCREAYETELTHSVKKCDEYTWE